MMVELSRGQQASQAWKDHFGSTTGFEQRWKAWWLAMPDEGSAEQYAQATVARLTSFLARAIAEKQTFKSFDEFRSAARSRQLKLAPDQWLPDSLLFNALADADDMSKAGDEFSLVLKSPPQIQCVLHNGDARGRDVRPSARPGGASGCSIDPREVNLTTHAYAGAAPAPARMLHPAQTA